MGSQQTAIEGYSPTMPYDDGMAFPIELCSLIDSGNFTGFSRLISRPSYLAKVDLNAKNSRAMTLLHIVSGGGVIPDNNDQFLFRKQVINKICDASSININVPGCFSDITPIMHAVEEGNVEATIILLQRGALTKAGDTNSHCGGLMHAIVSSNYGVRMMDYFSTHHKELTEELLNDPDSCGRTPIISLAYSNSKFSVSQLIEYGCCFTHIDNSGRTFVHHLCIHMEHPFPNFKFHDWECLRRLCTPAFVNKKDGTGKTALHYLLDVSCASFLLELGADREAIDSEGCTPAFNTNFFVRDVLLTEDVDFGRLNNKGHTVLWHAYTQFLAGEESSDSVISLVMNPYLPHNLCHGPDSYTSLHMAICLPTELNQYTIEYLLDDPQNCNPKALTKDNANALMMLASCQGYTSEDDTEEADILLMMMTIIYRSVALTGSLYSHVNETI
jgi:hypothetical protein